MKSYRVVERVVAFRHWSICARSLKAAIKLIETGKHDADGGHSDIDERSCWVEEVIVQGEPVFQIDDLPVVVAAQALSDAIYTNPLPLPESINKALIALQAELAAYKAKTEIGEKP